MDDTAKAIRLLIVDDDVLVRTLAAETLRASGFEVDEACDGPDAFAQIEHSCPDLLLLDVVMPVMDGYEVCRALRSRPELAHMPIIMLTGLDDTASIERAYDSGATDFIPKPINASLLTYRIRYALRARRMVDEIEQHRASLANAQRIARIGSWTWLPLSGRFQCSEQYRSVIGKPELAPGFQWRDFLSSVHPEDFERVGASINAAVEQGRPYAMVYRIVHRDGAERSLFEQTEVFCNDENVVVRIEGTTQDITDRVAAEERIRQLADYDGLTGLANRKLFGAVVQRGLHRCKRERQHAAVLHINLDRFKRINETLGSTAGDGILQEVSRRIVDSIRASDYPGHNPGSPRNDTHARMSGDSFAVFIAHLDRPEDAALIARRVSDAIAKPIQHEEHEFLLTASVGIAVYPDNGTDVDALFRNAESAMDSAKRQGAGQYCFFTPAMNTSTIARLEMENDLRRAIHNGELLLFYQARVDVPTGRLVGAEALVRWQHPQRGLVPPGQFIPIAEESGLIVPLTEWVLQGACRQLQQWQQCGLPMVPISINFSAHSFREDGLCTQIAAALGKHGIPASLLEGEITESAIMHDVERAVRRLHELRAIGIALAIDDFGTGYSSLAYLKRFPLKVLKIDRAFVKDVLTDVQDAAIASAIITLGQAMNLTVVAEGMETVDQANFLLARGCRQMQGFLFARPVPAEAFFEALRDGLKMPPGLADPNETASTPPRVRRIG